VQHGLAEKKENAQDGRSTLIQATGLGKKLLLRGRDRRVRVLAERVGGLDSDDRDVLKRAAEILKRVIVAI